MTIAWQASTPTASGTVKAAGTRTAAAAQKSSTASKSATAASSPWWSGGAKKPVKPTTGAKSATALRVASQVRPATETAVVKPDAPLSAAGAAATHTIKLCVGIHRSQASIERGLPATWIVSAWTTGGNVPDAVVRLLASPAGLPTQFSFGCGTSDGTQKCDLGEIASQSVKRQLEAQVTVPTTKTSLTSVRLSVVASAAHLPKEPRASATVTVTAPPTIPTGAIPTPSTSSAPLPIGALPSIGADTTGTSGSLSPGGNAGGLFPTLSPSATPSSGTPGPSKANARTVANTAALPLGAPVVGAQLAGLGALALAFVLAVTRLSIRRRPGIAKATAGSPSMPAVGPKPDPAPPGKETPEG